mgnify:CR=1 FL=1
MKFKKFIIICIITFFTFLIGPLYNINAENSEYVYLGGENIGIKLNTGITIVGKYEVETHNGKIKPWENSDIQNGDEIISIDSLKVSDNQSLLNVLLNSNKKTVKLEIKRKGKILTTTIDIVLSKSNQKSIGLYIKDKLLGIGTMTFIDPDTLVYGSLGHGIYHENELFENKQGVILSSKIDSIKKAEPGQAGEKRATLNQTVIGTVTNNTITGLYGKTLKNYIQDKKLIEVGHQDDVSIGKAEILTTLENNKVESYKIEIIGLEEQESIDIKGIKIKIIDDELINQTGGIIQGMSGSPIIQNGKIIGAVSHVTVDNPQIGYGMYIDWMLEEAKKS